MKRAQSVVLISCVKSKRRYRAPAKDLYDSTLFRAQRAYAEKVADKWFILSAKYGLLAPETEIEPYEETLKGASVKRKRDWSHAIFAELERVTARNDVITITAGEDYCRYLVPLLTQRGNEVRRPVKGLAMGYIPGRLYELISNAGTKTGPTSRSPAKNEGRMLEKGIQPIRASPTRKPTREDQIENFYSIIFSLAAPRQLADLTNKQVPSRGVYFFFENGEFRCDGTTPRIVRVGTHGLKALSKSTLYGRLAQHRGTRNGIGNHRGSVFRLHVGKAIINRDRLDCETWARGSNASRDVLVHEQEVEKAVSAYIGKMKVMLLEIPDEPRRDNRRAFVERNTIGLLAGQEPASKAWLGLYTHNPSIAQSYLWNVNHVGHVVEDGFIDCVKELVSNQQMQG